MPFTVRFQLEFSKYNRLYVDQKLFCRILNRNIVSTVEILAGVLTWIKAQKIIGYLLIFLIFGQSMSGTDLKRFSLISFSASFQIILSVLFARDVV